MTSDLTKSLQSTSMLVAFHGGYWEARRNDPNAVQQLESANNTHGDIGRFIKNTMAGADQEYVMACRQVRQAREKYYALTLPWSSKADGKVQGDRLLPTLQFNDFLEDMAMHRRKMAASVTTLAGVYDVKVKEAITHLGGLGDADDYPSVESIKSRFYIELEFQPVPDAANFGGLPEATLSHLTKHMEKSQTTMVNNAINDVFDRVKDTVGHMAETLADPDKKFHNSLVGNVEHLIKQMAGFNITNDPRLTELAVEMQRLVTEDPVDIRKKIAVREVVATDAAAVLAKLDAYNL